MWTSRASSATRLSFQNKGMSAENYADLSRNSRSGKPPLIAQPPVPRLWSLYRGSTVVKSGYVIETFLCKLPLSSPSVYYAEKAVRLRGIYLCNYPVPCGAIR